MSISVVIADDHAVVREGILVLLADANVRIIGQATTGPEALDKTLSLEPDVLLLDVRMGAAGGLHALEKLKDSDVTTRIVMISTFDNPTYVARSIALGANDYILKNSSREEMLAAIRGAHERRAPADGCLFARIFSLMAKKKVADEKLPLTDRESQVLRHIALGLSNREIGFSLKISVETVKEHVQNILRKIDAADRTQAAVWAVRNKLV